MQLRPGLRGRDERRRSASQPPPPAARSQQQQLLSGCSDEQFRLDPRYAEWYYAQRVRPARYPPPLATMTTAERVDAARHRRLPAAADAAPLCARRPLTPVQQTGGQPPAAAAACQATPPSSACEPTPGASPACAAFGESAGDFDRRGSSSSTSQPTPTKATTSESPQWPPAWAETYNWVRPRHKEHGLAVVGIRSTQGRPKLGVPRAVSGQYQCQLLQAMCDACQISKDHVLGLRLCWARQEQTQKDVAFVGFADAGSRARALRRSFSFAGGSLTLRPVTEEEWSGFVAGRAVRVPDTMERHL